MTSLLIVAFWAFNLVTVAFAEEFILMHKSIPRKDFIKKEASHPDALHKLVFAVRQNNLIEADALLMDRSTPGSSHYQDWLTFEEVGDLTSNRASAKAVLNWLAENGVTVMDTTARFEYITAIASITTWEMMLNTKFYRFKDHSRNSLRANSDVIHRAEQYSLPKRMRHHLHSVFNTVQVPVVLNRKDYSIMDETNAQMKTDMKDTAAAPRVTVHSLNILYEIDSHIASGVVSQTVVGLSEERFSPEDLSLFRETYDLPSQECLAPHTHSVKACDLMDDFVKDGDGSEDICYKSNVNVQYIMGIAQGASTVYWNVADNSTPDPYVAWLVDITNTVNPALVISMSYGAIEQVCAVILLPFPSLPFLLFYTNADYLRFIDRALINPPWTPSTRRR